MASSRTLWTGGLRRLLRPGPELVWTLSWVGTLGGIELLGRSATSDAGDAVSVMALASLGLLTWIRHTAQPLAWVRWIETRARRRWRQVRGRFLHIGLDLRGAPPLPERLPAVLVGPFALLLVACVVLALGRAHLPGDARELLLELSAAGYIVLLTALWGLLVAGLLLTFALPLVYLDVLARRSGYGERSRQRLILWGGAVHLVLLTTLARLLPVWAPVAGLFLTLAAFLSLTLRSAGKPLYVLWRQREPRTAPAVFRWTTLTVGVQLAAVGACLALVLLARGESLLEERGGDTPITAFLGLAFAWSFLAAYVVEWITVVGLIGVGWSKDPAKPRPPVVRVEGAHSPSERHRVRAALAAAGLRARFDERPLKATEVPIELDPFAKLDPFDDSWPRRLSIAHLEAPAVQAALHRRWELVCRRGLRKGLKKLLKLAAQQRFEKGTGYLIAPHLWVVTHLVRDVDEDEFGRIGPCYARALPIEVRHHAHQVFEALAIDLVFLEDGVRFRAFQRVLAMMFEHYDIFRGQRPLEERHFAGLPGVRVLIHEFELDEPLRFGGYPEPDYEHLGRARILHVFRDRGEGEEQAPDPRVPDYAPAPHELLPA